MPTDASNRVSTRRNFVAAAASTAAVMASAARPGGTVHARAPEDEGQRILPPGNVEHVIFIWLGGGMSQIDTFDPKRRGDSGDRRPGSDYDAIDTSVPNVQVCEHLPELARRMERVTAVRSCNHDMIDEHAAAVYWVHVGRPINGTIAYPSIGSAISHELGAVSEGAPAYSVIGYPNMARSPGFLGAKHGYLYLTDLETGPRGLMRPEYVDTTRVGRRLQMLEAVRKASHHKVGSSHFLKQYSAAQYENLRLSGEEFMPVFDLGRETDTTRNRYGGEFGQRCLLARRMTEYGVRFVEVAHNLNFVNGTGWDTHREGQQNQWRLVRELDTAVSALMDDLEDRKRLDKTLIVIGTEFGRPAGFDAAGGRGHQSTAFTLVLAGGGLNH
ncbi:MAG TPA: DUF1501 domain-containing protein, partial [Planctomycetaceae bacterium]|nr:DUF1501 domain-containing protein [Planctomycetaceae bacterium]